MTDNWPNADPQTAVVLAYITAAASGAIIGAALMAVVCWL